jgi:hypothetical protein
MRWSLCLCAFVASCLAVLSVGRADQPPAGFLSGGTEFARWHWVDPDNNTVASDFRLSRVGSQLIMREDTFLNKESIKVDISAVPIQQIKSAQIVKGGFTSLSISCVISKEHCSTTWTRQGRSGSRLAKTWSKYPTRGISGMCDNATLALCQRLARKINGLIAH